MSRAGLAVSASAASPTHQAGKAIEVDGGVGLPVAYGGLRKVIQALREVAPAAVESAARERPAEWNRLFPGSIRGAPELSDLALTPSERRLHRESEQTFWVLNLGARLVVDALRDSGRSLVIRNTGQMDLVSLRGLMRAVEWARMDGLEKQLSFSDWGARHGRVPGIFERRHRESLAELRERMRISAADESGAKVDRPIEAPIDPESQYLCAAVDRSTSPERRIAAAVLAIRACFFTTNYEGGMLAAEEALAALSEVGSRYDQAAVLSAWDELDDTNFVTPAIEVDRSSIGDAEETRALIHREIGVIHAFTGQWQATLDAFAQGLECKLRPERRAQLRMFRALTWIKRLGNLTQARAEIEDGLQAIAKDRTDVYSLHEGWLRNVYALTYFQEKALEPALAQEKLAMRCVAELHDPSATHLKINLISNISVLQESAKLFPEAIGTWRKYEKFSKNWGSNFLKHHSYRLAGLTLKSGNRDEAVRIYQEAYQAAVTLGDPFHRQAIAAELGRQALEQQQKDVAKEWFDRALESARAIGDPLRISESLAGLALAQGSTSFSEPLRLAEASSTYPKEAQALAGALASGDAAKVQALLPAPRTKLNRPFDLVNL